VRPSARLALDGRQRHSRSIVVRQRMNLVISVELKVTCTDLEPSGGTHSSFSVPTESFRRELPTAHRAIREARASAVTVVSSAWALSCLATGPSSNDAIICAPCPKLPCQARGLFQCVWSATNLMSKAGPTCCPSDLLRSSNHSDAQLVDAVDGTVAHVHGCAGALPPAETPQPHNTWAAAECQPRSRRLASVWYCWCRTCNKRSAYRNSLFAEAI
jgi:hypothetical protein